MGWFLSQKSKKSGKGGAKAKGKSNRAAKLGAGVDGESDGTSSGAISRRGLVLGTVRLVLGIGLVVGLGYGWTATSSALSAYASSRHGSPVTTQNVLIVDRPVWMTDSLAMRLRQTVAQRIGADPMNGRDLREAAAALGQDPWVERVGQVQRMADGTIRVEARFRQPLAVVRGRDGYHLVDRRMIRLPGLYAKHQIKLLGLPLMLGVDSPPPQFAGGRWTSSNLKAGLDLLAMLQSEPFFDQIEAVDLNAHDARGRLRLILYTARGRVVWGLAPGQSGAIEPNASVKLDRLRQVVNQYGVLDAGGRVVHVHGATTQIERGSTRNEKSAE